jgi:hypothetical protein
LENKSNYITSVKSLNFFEELRKECSKQSEIQIDTVNFLKTNENITYLSLACLLIKDSLNEFIVYNGEYFEFNSKYYKMNCDIYSLYIDLIPIYYAYSATPRFIIDQKCNIFKKIKKISYKQFW